MREVNTKGEFALNIVVEALVAPQKRSLQKESVRLEELLLPHQSTIDRHPTSIQPPHHHEQISKILPFFTAIPTSATNDTCIQP
jgi:hypothetical protein